MKKFVISALAIGCIGFVVQSASAADMAVKASAPAAAPFSWTGFYLGAEGGYGNVHTDTLRNVANTNFPVGFSSSFDYHGGLAGFDGGANYQWNWLVLGVEGDWQASGMTGTHTEFSPLIAGHYTVSTRETDWIATVTGRLGVAWDRWMLYGKGGGAWRRVNDTASNMTFTGAGALLAVTTVAPSSESGYVIGGGVEWAPSDTVSAKLEYDWYNFGSQSSAATTCVLGTCGVGTVTPAGESTVKPTAWEIKGGLNVRFNGLLASH